MTSLLRRSTAGLIGLCLALIVLAPGCNALDFVPLETATKTISEDFKTSSTPRVTVETFNGSIDVSRGGDDAVVVDVTKRATGFDKTAAEAALDSVRVTMIQKDDTVTITAVKLDNRPGNFGASVVIAVPAAAELKLHSSNGGVICEEARGRIDASTSNGRLEIVDGRGPLKLSTSNGTIDVQATDAVVDARTSNGRIKFQGSLAEAEHKFKSSNGKIELVLPDDAQFHLTAGTSNSRVRCDFPIDAETGKRRSHLEGVVGKNPDCSITVGTSNGSIAIQKASGHDSD